MSITTENPLADFLGGTRAQLAAEAFLAADAMVQEAKTLREAARVDVIAEFSAVGLVGTTTYGVNCTTTNPREFDHAAAARLDVPNLTEPRTTAARVDACRQAGTLTARQYARIVTVKPGFKVEAARSAKARAA